VPTPARPPPRLGRLFALSGLAHLAADALASRLVATTPPYLLLRYAPEAFQGFLDPIGVSIAASAVNAAISTIMAVALEHLPRGRRRFLSLGGLLAALWVLSGGLLALIYLSAPWPVTLGSLAAGLPRAAAVAWLLDRALPRPDLRGAGPG
jgi:hypothetical protein